MGLFLRACNLVQVNFICLFIYLSIYAYIYIYIYFFSSSVVYREVHSPDQEENPRETKEETETTVGFNVDMLSQDHQVNSDLLTRRNQTDPLLTISLIKSSTES